MKYHVIMIYSLWGDEFPKVCSVERLHKDGFSDVEIESMSEFSGTKEACEEWAYNWVAAQ